MTNHTPQEKLAALPSDLDPRQNPERARFEEWYTTHAFDYAANPIGSRDCDLQWRAWKAALLSEHGEVTVTTDESGRCVAVTRQDSEGRILSTIWEASEHRESPPDGGGGEAVYQVRRRHDPIYKNPPWSEVSRGNYESLASYAGYERRILYTTPPTPSAPVGVVPDCVIVLLNHLEDLMDKGELAEDAIPIDMWNAISMHNFTPPVSEQREVGPAPSAGVGVEGLLAGAARCLRWLARTADPEDATEAEAHAAKLEALTHPAAAPRVEQECNRNCDCVGPCKMQGDQP